MIMKQFLKTAIFLLLTFHAILPTWSQNHHDRFHTLDVLGYHFEIKLNDTSDVIHCITNIEIEFLKEVDQFHLDLSYKPEEGTGMLVQQITEDGRAVKFLQENDQIWLSIPLTQQGAKRNYRISYNGIPSDGLIISKNMFGDRTFFGDNWPNRGHHWLPLVDHPSDKATVEFLVKAPAHYEVVSIGKKVAEKREAGTVRSHWQTSVPLSTKLMVIGVSPFAVQELQSSSGIPVSTWVYPQNKEKGFFDYSIATKPLEYFETYIAPYPYAKLANVQSKTVYGGMENASCIFYHERTVTGKQDHEVLFAHEIAHQWFGDAVSEMDWHHIWLSEGFATYLTDMYIEQAHGREAFISSMLDEKQQVIRFSKRRLAPIVDTTLPVSTRLLNKNTYEKAGWVLHMLRNDMGDRLFQECVQTFYNKYKFANALTEDFLEVVESVSGKEYDAFFQQWFYQPGHPVLSAKWKKRGNKVTLTLNQHQEQYLFEFPLDVELTNDKGEVFRKTLSIKSSSQSFTFRPPFKAKKHTLDPDSRLLFEIH